MSIPWGEMAYLALSGFIAWQFYKLGRENERRQARNENNWWGGFRAGRKNMKRIVEEECARMGLTPPWRASDSQHN